MQGPHHVAQKSMTATLPLKFVLIFSSILLSSTTVGSAILYTPSGSFGSAVLLFFCAQLLNGSNSANVRTKKILFIFLMF
jgi:hypothetical protein